MNDDSGTDNAIVKVSSDALQQALALVLAEIVEREGDQFTIAQDYFWSLPPASMYVADDKPPTDLTIGRLSETVEYIDEISTGMKPPIDYALVWIADILRAVAVKPRN